MRELNGALNFPVRRKEGPSPFNVSLSFTTTHHSHLHPLAPSFSQLNRKRVEELVRQDESLQFDRERIADPIEAAEGPLSEG